MIVQSPPLILSKPTRRPSASKPTPAKTKYWWKVKVDFNKKKYLVDTVISKDVLKAEMDQPSTSYNSTIVAKAKLLQIALSSHAFGNGHSPLCSTQMHQY